MADRKQRWNFGMPRAGAEVVHYRDVRVNRGGQRWTASWHIEGGRLVLSSAWGSRSEPVSPDLPLEALQDRARGMLDRMIAEERGI